MPLLERFDRLVPSNHVVHGTILGGARALGRLVELEPIRGVDTILDRT